MKYSQQEIIQYVQGEDVKFIRLAFCDVFGKQKNQGGFFISAEAMCCRRLFPEKRREGC